MTERHRGAKREIEIKRQRERERKKERDRGRDRGRKRERERGLSDNNSRKCRDIEEVDKKYNASC